MIVKINLTAVKLEYFNYENQAHEFEMKIWQNSWLNFLAQQNSWEKLVGQGLAAWDDRHRGGSAAFFKEKHPLQLAKQRSKSLTQRVVKASKLFWLHKMRLKPTQKWQA